MAPDWKLFYLYGGDKYDTRTLHCIQTPIYVVCTVMT